MVGRVVALLLFEHRTRFSLSPGSVTITFPGSNGGTVGEMNEENDAVGVPSSFSTGQGFPTAEPTIEEEESGYPYPYEVMEPEPVQHPFRKPEVPEAPKTREQLEAAVPQYVRYVLKEYDLELELDRLTVEVDGRFTRALGKCGPNGYHTARVRVSSKHYVDRSYSWERCKETIRHELAHAWQARWLGYTSHGPTFREKALEMDCDDINSRYGDESEPKYVAHCQGCGSVYKRQRACKATRNPYTKCSNCGTAGYELDSIEEDHTWIIFDNTDWHKAMG